MSSQNKNTLKSGENFMKTFLVLLKEKSMERLDDKLLNEHIQHLHKLSKSKNLLLCGPFADDSGAMLIIQADSRMTVDFLIQSDPFVKNSYYGSYTITEFYKADESNNYLMDHDQTIGELNKK